MIRFHSKTFSFFFSFTETIVHLFFFLTGPCSFFFGFLGTCNCSSSSFSVSSLSDDPFLLLLSFNFGLAFCCPAVRCFNTSLNKSGPFGCTLAETDDDTLTVGLKNRIIVVFSYRSRYILREQS